MFSFSLNVWVRFEQTSLKRRNGNLGFSAKQNILVLDKIRFLCKRIYIYIIMCLRVYAVYGSYVYCLSLLPTVEAPVLKTNKTTNKNPVEK